MSARAAAPPHPAAWAGRGAGLAAAVRATLARLALGAPTRVFVLEGADPPGAPDLLRLRDDVRLVDTPRSATVLLVAGRLPHALDEPARRLHDAMAHPRAVVWWAPAAAEDTMGDGAGALPVAAVVRPPARGSTPGGTVDPADPRATLEAVASAIRGVAGELLRGTRASSPGLLPDVDPAPWRGVGPYGQGGSGMTGGVPYGRPMAGRAPDRDALELDQLPVRVGPFFAPFPPGLVLDVRLQGDVLQDVVVPGNAFASAANAPPRAADDGGPPHGAHGHAHDHAPAHGHGVPPAMGTAAPAVAPPLVATLERARASHHLRWLAHALRVHGLDALGRRTLALAAGALRDAPERVAGEVAVLGRLLERSRALGWATAGVGVIAAGQVADRGLGPVARAAGHTEDARLGDPAYQALGFEPVVSLREGGDARARWRQRLAEAAQGLALAGRAGDRRAGEGTGSIEGPRGPRLVGLRLTAASDGLFGTTSGGVPGGASAALLALLPDLLREQEWGDAITTVVSLDLDVREAAPGMTPLAPPPKVKSAGGMGGMGGMGVMRGMQHDTGGMPGGDDEHAGHGGHGA